MSKGILEADSKKDDSVYKRLKEFSKGKKAYENDSDALRDIAALIVELCERNDELVPLIADGFEGLEEMAEALADLEDYVYGEEDCEGGECDCDECGHGHEHDHEHNQETKQIEMTSKGDGIFAINCPVCQHEIEFAEEKLSMEEAIDCPECKTEIGIMRVHDCGDGCGDGCGGGCSH